MPVPRSTLSPARARRSRAAWSAARFSSWITACERHELVTGDDGAGEAHRAHQHRDGRLGSRRAIASHAAPPVSTCTRCTPARTSRHSSDHTRWACRCAHHVKPRRSQTVHSASICRSSDVEHRPQARVVGDRRPGPETHRRGRAASCRAQRRPAPGPVPESLLDQLRRRDPGSARLASGGRSGSWGLVMRSALSCRVQPAISVMPSTRKPNEASTEAGVTVPASRARASH